jgi:D-alanyl-D-alanine carboxypeptidase (penicillin-binding protein 5/6)
MKVVILLCFLLSSVFVCDVSFSKKMQTANTRQSANVNTAANSTEEVTHNDSTEETDKDPILNSILSLARYAYVYDVTTEQEIASKYSYESLTPSSMTKIMTLYILFKLLREGKIKLDEEVDILYEVVKGVEGSSMFLRPGSRVCIEKIIEGIAAVSANDACVVIANYICGGEVCFSAMMNEEAHVLGMKNTHFENASGLPNPNHYSSARDLCVLSIALLKEFPEFFARFLSLKTYEHEGIIQNNNNSMLNDEVDGIKTGMTKDGGYGICVSVKRDGMRVFIVINGCASNADRIKCAKALIEYSFRHCTREKIITAGQIIKSIDVDSGNLMKIDLAAERDVSFLSKRFKSSAVKPELQFVILKDKAPIFAGEKVAECIVIFDGREHRIGLLSVQNVKKINPVRLFIRTVFNKLSSFVSR